MKKLFPTVLLAFIIITVFSFPTITKKNTMRTNLEIEKQVIPTNTIYLLNSNDYLVEIDVVLSEQNKVKNIIDYLKEENRVNTPWKGYIPQEVELIDYKLKNGLLEIHFSEELNKMDKKYLSGITESFLKQKEIEKVDLYIENEKITIIPSINLEKEKINRTSLDKIVIYYIEDIEKNHLVPVTKYQQSNDEMVREIIKELKENIPSDLISYVSDQLEIKEYQIENDIMEINFNNKLVEDPDKKNWLLKEIAYSIMKNYSVNGVLFKVNGKQEELVLK